MGLLSGWALLLIDPYSGAFYHFFDHPTYLAQNPAKYEISFLGKAFIVSS